MAFIAIVVFLFVVGIYGQVAGEEFSPQKFTMRRFSYAQIPLLRIQVWPVKFSNVNTTEDALAQYIRRSTRTNNVASRIRRSPARWDIVTLREAGSDEYRGDASILTNYLQQPGAVGLESWLDWTKANPKLAGELWAVVMELANADLYVVVPDVLEAARNLDASNFGVQLRKIAATECRAIANAHNQSGDSKRATSILTFAKRIESEKVVDGGESAGDEEATNAEADPESDDLEAEIDRANQK